MSWTKERVELLQNLWGKGKSASEIAEILGGISRNAVIGKAHRLGLSGRPSPIASDKPRSTAKTRVKKHNKSATILDLTERMCRWPIGDPKKPGFRFCGKATVMAGVPYCKEHIEMAYQQPQSRNKRVQHEEPRALVSQSNKNAAR